MKKTYKPGHRPFLLEVALGVFCVTAFTLIAPFVIFAIVCGLLMPQEEWDAHHART